MGRYSSNPRIQLLNAAVAATDGEVTLFVPGSGASPKASLNPLHYRRFGFSPSVVRNVKVQSYSVKTLLKEQRIDRINILQLDTEGMDFETLQWFFATGQQPDLINMESLHLSKHELAACRDLLRSQYWYIETEQDTFAIRASLATQDRRQL